MTVSEQIKVKKMWSQSLEGYSAFEKMTAKINYSIIEMEIIIFNVLILLENH